MFFAAEHHTSMKILELVEAAMRSAMIVQIGVAKGTIHSYNLEILLNNIADSAAAQIIREKSILKCEPSIN